MLSEVKIEGGDSDDRRAIRSPSVGLIFERAGDRWTHAIEVGSAVARAVEWEPDRDDPDRVVSPVYQEITIRRDPAGRAQALLVGRAGRHHFSAAFTFEHGPADATIVVEVADRCRGPVSALGATYTVLLPPGDLAEADPSRVAWRLQDRLLTFLPGRETSASLAEAGRGATRVQALADSVENLARTRTLVCNYQWSVRRTDDAGGP